MKKSFSSRLLLAGIVILNLFSSCTKSENSNDQQPIAKKEYRLFNESTGVPLDAGMFTISQLADGNAALTINLAAAYRVENDNLPTYILTNDITGRELVYANLSATDGNTGVGITSPVLIAGGNLTIKYADLIARKNYLIEVLNGSKVHAKGIIN